MRDFCFSLLKSLFVAIIFSLVAVLVLSLISHFCNFSSVVLLSCCQVFKVLAIFLGCLCGVRLPKCLLKGVTFGILYIVIAFFLFGAMAGSITVTYKFFIEIVIGGVAGMLSSLLVATLGKKNS
jgi:hypothetical protein